MSSETDASLTPAVPPPSGAAALTDTFVDRQVRGAFEALLEPG